MLKRAEAVDACMARFAGKPYAPGTRDCGKLAAHVLHQMGHPAPLLNRARHTTEAGAVRYIRRQGFASLVELMDATGLSRIAPAAALPGDVVALESGDAFGCSLTVALDNGLVLGFAGGVCQPIQPHAFVAAWRV